MGRGYVREAALLKNALMWRRKTSRGSHLQELMQ
jgi:hypothetical protein